MFFYPAPTVLFDLTFNLFALLSLLALVINSFLIYIIASKDTSSPTNRWFILLLLCLIPWSLGEFMGRLSATAQAAAIWNSIGIVGWIFVGQIFFAFTLAYVGKEKFINNFFNQIWIFGGSIFFLFLGWSTNLIQIHDASLYKKVAWGWSAPSPQWFPVSLFWIDIFFVVSIYLLIQYFRKTTNTSQKKQTFWIITATLIPIIGGSISDGILPILLPERVFPMAVILTAVMSILITFAIARYQLFVLNPSKALSAVIDAMTEALIVFDQENKIQFVNKTTTMLLGIKRENLLQKNITEIIPKNMQDTFHTGILKQLTINQMVKGVQLNVVSADNEEIPVRFSASKLTNKNKITGYVGVLTDVRKERDLINSLTAERNKISVTLANIDDGVITLNSAGEIIIINKACEQMLKIETKNVINKKLSRIVKIKDENGANLKIEELLPRDNVKKDRNIKVLKNIEISTAANVKIMVNLTSSTIAEAREVNLGSILTLHNVSKEQELERMKLDFVSMAVHELRTPLTVLNGFISVFINEYAAKLTSEQNKFLSNIQLSADELTKLVENLLSASKIERGVMSMELELVDWNKCITGEMTNFQTIAKKKGIKLTFKPTGEKLNVKVDKLRICEVVTNLVSNAINYNRPNGEITISTERAGNQAVTRIKDTGIGIPKEAIPHLFSKFYKVENQQHTANSTGLGLFISKNIIELHKGKIWAESQIGKGSIFSFSIPVTK